MKSLPYTSDRVERFFRSPEFKRLKRAVEERRERKSLEMLEKAGITGDLAVYLVAVAHGLDGEHD